MSLNWIRSLSSLASVKLGYEDLLTHSGRWRQGIIWCLKDASRWHGWWVISNTFNGCLKDCTLHVGWVGIKAGDPVDNKDICRRYKKEIINHAGVCFFNKLSSFCLSFYVWLHLPEPEFICSYNPKHKIFNSEVKLIHNLEPLEVTDSDMEKFKEHGDKCDIWGGIWLTYTKTELKSHNINICATFSIMSREWVHLAWPVFFSMFWLVPSNAIRWHIKDFKELHKYQGYKCKEYEERICHTQGSMSVLVLLFFPFCQHSYLS
jgi:hypothetical protein